MLVPEVQAILDAAIRRHPSLSACEAAITDAFRLLSDTFRSGGKLLVCGNGGSAADSEHIAGELNKSFRLRRPLREDLKRRLQAACDDGGLLADRLQEGLPTLSLVNALALGTAFANDVDPELVYAQQVLVHGRAGDTLLGISTSGNARNVLQAMKVARVLGLATLGLTGETGGRLVPHCDVLVRVPETETYLVQELHFPIYHALCAMLEQQFFGTERGG